MPINISTLKIASFFIIDEAKIMASLQNDSCVDECVDCGGDHLSDDCQEF